ncbi:MAG: 3-oxoacyl-[acyl-carrier-protein] reductase FabG [Calditrichaeota bacterium]|nr:3-oxoacyl-[acyl-carrier-protein] reductase FabG [Calditrichota bacterium]
MAEQLLSGKVALVTGGSRGIGAAIVRHFAEEGAGVAFTYRKQKEAADALAAEAEKLGVRAKAYQADTADFDRAQKLVAEVIDTFGALDILVNNAGMNRDGVIWKMSEEQWDAVISVDLKGCFNTIRAAAPHFREQRAGRIVNVTSINGLRGKFGQANYSAAKAGVIGLTKTVAKELGGRGITVNSVAPGLIMTDMMQQMPEQAKQASLDETALRKLGEPEDIAWICAFLASDRARHITGEIIKVDGGQYI